MPYSNHKLNNAMKEKIITGNSWAYARQSNAPEWFDACNPLHFCNTSGSSPCNEWAGFHSEKQALKWASLHSNNHQGFIDSFEDVDGQYFRVEDVNTWEDDNTGELVITPIDGAKPATVADLVCALLEH